MPRLEMLRFAEQLHGIYLTYVLRSNQGVMNLTRWALVSAVLCRAEV